LLCSPSSLPAASLSPSLGLSLLLSYPHSRTSVLCFGDSHPRQSLPLQTTTTPIMTKLKQVRRSANLAWSPNPAQPNLLATATSAGSIGDGFDTTSSIEIFEFDASNASSDMPVVGKIDISERVQDFAWGAQGTRSHGLLAGGFSNGAVSIWDPAAILAQSYVHYTISSISSISSGELDKHSYSLGFGVCCCCMSTPATHRCIADTGSGS
jgi:hypothetical protein